MAQPQRGQVVALPAQVVPQEEQVLVAQVAPRLLTQEEQPEHPLEAVEPFLSGQFCFGNSGRLKNSSQTFSANSSQGGTAHTPYDGTIISTSATTLRMTVTQMVMRNWPSPR